MVVGHVGLSVIHVAMHFPNPVGSEKSGSDEDQNAGKNSQSRFEHQDWAL
jgi:hypothetical protein